MPRQRTDLVRQYFKYRSKRNDSLCLANVADDPAINYGIETDRDLQCRRIMAGSKVSNLKSHLKSRHPRIYIEFQRRNNEQDHMINGKRKTSNDDTEEESDVDINNNVTTPVVPHQTIGSRMKGLLELVTVNGRPLSIVEDSGFLVLCGSSMKEHEIRHNRRNIVKLVRLAADVIRKEISEFVDNYLVSVKVDCVNKFGRFFVGIHIQVNRDGQVVIFSLPVWDLDPPEEGEKRDFKDLILKELAKYSVSSQQIYSITAEAGANMLPTMKLIDKDCGLSSYENLDQVKEDKKSNILADEILNADWQFDGILAIPCAAHCLQLAVMDTLKNTKNKKIDNYTNYLLKKVRIIIQELRTPQQSAYLKKQNLSEPILDVETRWSSTFLMIESLLNLKDYCISSVNLDRDDFAFSKNEWNELDELWQCLEPFYVATKKLQDENLTLTDVYKILNICYMEISAIETEFSEQLSLNFIKRRERIMENVLMLSALYLDPRFSFELTGTQREIAIKNILNIHQRLRLIDCQLKINTNETGEEVGNQSVDMDCDDAESLYELFLKTKDHALRMEHSSQPSFEDILVDFQYVPRISSKTSILQFWEENKNKYSSLYEIARIVLAVPGTQLSMKCVLNQLRYVLNDQHRRLTPKTLENVLLVRSNFKYLNDSFFE